MKTASEFLAWSENLGSSANWTKNQRDEREKLFLALPADEKYLVQRHGVDEYFTESNLVAGSERTSLSPSGRYRLVTSSYGTKPGAWSFTRGQVFRVSDGEQLADIKRNYSDFDWTWLEDQPGGDFGVGGNDYQGQSFVYLNTGTTKHHIPDDAFFGAGFCWTGARVLMTGALLVDGCYWACPFKYRLYDISDPMSGWPELVPPGNISFEYEQNSSVEASPEGMIVHTRRLKVFKADGKNEREIESESMQINVNDKAAYEAFQSRYPDEDEDAHLWGLMDIERTVLRLEGRELKLVEHWQSPWLLESRRKQAEWSAKREEDTRRWTAESVLLARLKALAAESGVTDRFAVGYMWPSKNMKDNGDTNPIYFTVELSNKHGNRRVHLEWGVSEGEIKLSYSSGCPKIKMDFPRSEDGAVEAWRHSFAFLEEAVETLASALINEDRP